MDAPTPAKPNRATRRRTVKEIKRATAATKDRVITRRAAQLADKLEIPAVVGAVGGVKRGRPIKRPAPNIGFSESGDATLDYVPEDIPSFAPQDIEKPGIDPTRPERAPHAPDVPPRDLPEIREKLEPRLTPTDEEIIDGISQMYFQIALLLYPFEPYDAQILMANAEASARSLVRVAKHHKRMYKILRRIAAGNDYMTLVTVHLGIAVALGAHHKLAPAGMPGMFRVKMPESEGENQQWTDPNSSSSPPSFSTSGISSDTLRGGLSNWPVPSDLPPNFQELVQKAAAMQPGVPNPIAAATSYDPSDTAARPEQNPAISLVRRD